MRRIRHFDVPDDFRLALLGALVLEVGELARDEVAGQCPKGQEK